MKTMKKVLAMLLTLAMVMGMTMTTMAADAATPSKPTKDDTAIAKVTNVDKGCTVTAYQIVKGEYNDNGFVKYVKANDSLSIADVKNPTADEILTIALGDVTKLGKISMTDANADGTYEAELNAGYWVVLISGGEEIYNPVLVGVYYSVSGSDNTLVQDPTGGISADSIWSLNTTTGYAKSSKPTIDKAIVNYDKNEGENASGNNVAIGDTVNFKIDTMIPAYSKSYESVKVVISDVLSAGLSLKQDSIAIKIGGSVYTPATGVLTTTPAGFTFNIPSADALANAGKAVAITYDAVVDTDAGLNYDENTNKATLEYSHNPKDANDTTFIDDITYTYTFGIDALLNGKGSNKTEELFKVAVDAEGNVVYDCKTTTTKYEVKNPLAGATFTLTENTTKKVYTATSDENGMLSFTGLDAGTYTLVETVAPQGYSINNETHTVVITAQHDEKGRLVSYSIAIDGKATSTYTATYDGGENITSEVQPTEIKNTKLVNLPSTGGIGTTIFTLGGCAIMIAAAFLFFASRKKEEA